MLPSHADYVPECLQGTEELVPVVTARIRNNLTSVTRSRQFQQAIQAFFFRDISTFEDRDTPIKLSSLPYTILQR